MMADTVKERLDRLVDRLHAQSPCAIESRKGQPTALATTCFDNHIKAEKRITAALFDYYIKNSKLPSQRELIKLANSSYLTVKPVLTKFRAEMGLNESEQKFDIYRFNLLTRVNYARRVIKKPCNFTYEDRLAIDDAMHSLMDTYLSKYVYLITLTVAVNTPETDRAMCKYSDIIVIQLMRRLEKYAKENLWFVRWERDKTTAALHLHVYMPVINGHTLTDDDQERLEIKFQKIWAKILPPEIGSVPMKVHLKHHPHFSPEGHAWVYPAKSSQARRRRVTSDDDHDSSTRTPKRWFHISADLQKLVKSQVYKQRIYIHQKDLDNVIERAELRAGSKDRLQRLFDSIHNNPNADTNWRRFILFAPEHERFFEAAISAAWRRGISFESHSPKTYVVEFECHPSGKAVLKYVGRRRFLRTG
jgi:hypothetical protein